MHDVSTVTSLIPADNCPQGAAMLTPSSLLAILLITWLGCETAGLAESPIQKSRKVISSTGSNPTWSPDSTSIAIGHDGEGGIVVVHIDDLSRKRIADAGKDPAWSPDDRCIAYISPRDGCVYVQNADNQNSPLRIAAGLNPHWLKQTKELVYADPNSHSLVAAKLSLNTAGQPVSFKSRVLSKITEPFSMVSPSGDRLAFATQQGLFVGTLNRSSQPKLLFSRKEERGFLCDWSSDSRKLAFGGFLGSQLGIWIAEVEGKEPAKQLAPAGTKPAWSPDGHWIAFDRSASKNPGIEIIDVETAMAQAPSEADLTAATAKLALQNLVVECPRQVYQPHAAIIDSFFQYADRNVPIAENILGIKAGQKIVVRIEESDKTGCRCTGDIIYVSSRCLIEASLRRWMHVAFPHEVVHWFLGVKVTPLFPAWFVEPPATFVGYEIARRLGQKEVASEDETKFLRWGEEYQKRGLKTVWQEHFPADTDNQNRGMAYIILRTLVQRHGWDLFGKFINALVTDHVNFPEISDIQEKQQVMIRYLSKAAGKDLTGDFQKWGFIGVQQ